MRGLRKILFDCAPPVFALLVFLSGVVLLLSGAAPPFPENAKWLQAFAPLSLVEISHLSGSLIGVCLLFLSRGVFLRLDAAYYGCLILFAGGALASLLKGLDWREASLLTTMFLVFLPTHKYFYRKSSLFSIDLPLYWMGMIGATLGGALWLGFYSYQNVAYADDLWWEFTFMGDAPRFLRAMAVTIGVATAFILYRLIRPAAPLASNEVELQNLLEIRDMAARSHDTTGFLALLGDKHVLWSVDRSAFIMYAVTPRLWIAMGDPVGDPASFGDLVWDFRAQADRYGARTAFYEVSDKYLPLYLDMGLMLLKIGEEARVNLPAFNLEGGKREKQRKTHNRFSKGGFVMRFLTAEEFENALPQLQRISNEWLIAKKAREKQFSLGFFHPDYLRMTKVAVIEKEGRFIAFANLWTLDNKTELTIDLMRYETAAPANVMEYLFVSLMLWARDEGYSWLNMGMAPLSGLETHPLAPLWHKIGMMIFRHGEEFYNFEGLYQYKDKFDPVWTPHYIALPAGARAPLALMQVASVISGNLVRVFKRS